MNLKEAFRYQNFIKRMLGAAQAHLSVQSNVTKTIQKHLRSKANSEAVDEEIDTSKERLITIKPDIIVKFMVSLLDEHKKLCEAISKAKANCGLDIDSAIAMNTKRQQVVCVLENMNNIKQLKRIISGHAYKFNAEGNQVPYVYDIEESVFLDFDRGMVKSYIKELNSECDKISSQIDKIMVETEVDYAAPYDVNDNFEDALSTFAEKQGVEEMN